MTTMSPPFAYEYAAIYDQKAIRNAAILGNSPVQKFYDGSVVFVTGASGFLGKLLIEKLLRTCVPNKIYALIRHKNNKTPKGRLFEVFSDPLFEELRGQQINFEEKVVPVEGDIGEIKLGISDDDWKRLSAEVDVIFHIAANVRFDADLKSALLSNTRGTREALHLGAGCRHLRAFVHVSTAYTHATPDRINDSVAERFYETPAPPDAIIELAESLSAEKMNAIKPILVGDWPNVYTYTKALAEEIIRIYGANMPTCMIRPAIVTATYRDPFPGWVDISSAYGPSGGIIAVGLGIAHLCYIDDSIKMDIVPADIVNNATIVAAYETACKRDPLDTDIYTVSNSRHPLWSGTMRKYLLGNKETIAYSQAIWYCFAIGVKNKLLYKFLSLFLHYIPAYLVDGICLLLGKPRKLVKVYNKIDKLSFTLSYFTTNQWKFEDDNLQNLYKNLSPIDKQIFGMDITTLNWKEKIHFWCLGVRKYLLKDPPQSCGYGLKKQKVFRVLNYLVSIIYLYLIWKFAKLCFDLLSMILYKIFILRNYNVEAHAY